MKAYQKTHLIKSKIINRYSVDLPFEAVDTLRRAALVLSRWGEAECGDQWGNCIERDESTGKPFRTYDMGDRGKRGRDPIPDREAGALRRIEKVCKEHGLSYYHQTDPRGAPLYVAREVLTDQNYSSRGVCVWVD